MIDSPREIDLGVAWEWEYDADFVYGLAAGGQARGLSVSLIHPRDLARALHGCASGRIRFRTFLDRGSDNVKEFTPLCREVVKSRARLINDYPQMAWCMDKATMHLEFLANGLRVPYTIILSAYNHEPEIRITDLARLGRPFIIKPSMGSGGTGVVLGAESLADVLRARKSQDDQKFLLQEKIEPKLFDGRRAWFRVYWVVGHTFIVWWNDVTHIYRELEDDEEDRYGLAAMRRITTKIADISKLDFFSAEIAITPSNEFVVVDYVNDIVDMRLQSVHPDGVPDKLVAGIIDAIVDFVAGYQPALPALDPARAMLAELA